MHPPLSSYAPSCREYSSRFSSEDTVLFCMRVMVGVIILYDHVHPNGAFNKSSKIDVGRAPETRSSDATVTKPVCDAACLFLPPQMKGCIKVLKDQPADKVEGLLNALK